jgi:hypothetical protein
MQTFQMGDTDFTPGRTKVISERRLISYLAVALAALYLSVATTFAALKLATPFFGVVPWREVVNGPAISVWCTFVLCYGGVRLERWIRSRR